ncbi:MULTISPECIES: hypothetical protein [Bacillus]|uniref:hypothetical protein n=1 Tax=Bacillus TaxID=1386 RepID=UPI001E5A85EB|nr:MULTISPECIES: hypothetical protein [Bacillus]MCC8353806.1 hypothetical protein [Bacillus sp. AF23]MEC1546660.1 hypothetical protein [Bacillus halotolerans]
MAGLIEERDQDAAALWENITLSSHIVMEDEDLQRVLYFPAQNLVAIAKQTP